MDGTCPIGRSFLCAHPLAACLLCRHAAAAHREERTARLDATMKQLGAAVDAGDAEAVHSAVLQLADPREGALLVGAEPAALPQQSSGTLAGTAPACSCLPSTESPFHLLNTPSSSGCIVASPLPGVPMHSLSRPALLSANPGMPATCAATHQRHGSSYSPPTPPLYVLPAPFSLSRSSRWHPPHLRAPPSALHTCSWISSLTLSSLCAEDGQVRGPSRRTAPNSGPIPQGSPGGSHGGQRPQHGGHCGH